LTAMPGLVEGVLGLDLDVPGRILRLAPHLPPAWPDVAVSQFFPCFLRSSFVNHPLCDISAFHPDSAGDCLGPNHTGCRSLRKHFLSRASTDVMVKFAEQESPRLAPTGTEWVGGEFSGACHVKDAARTNAEKICRTRGVYKAFHFFNSAHHCDGSGG